MTNRRVLSIVLYISLFLVGLTLLRVNAVMNVQAAPCQSDLCIPIVSCDVCSGYNFELLRCGALCDPPNNSLTCIRIPGDCPSGCSPSLCYGRYCGTCPL